MNRLRDRLQQVLERVDAAQRRRRSTAMAVGVLKKFGEDRAGSLAALVAYYSFFSLFPLLLVMVTVVGFLTSGDDSLRRQLVDSTLARFPVIGDQLQLQSLSGSGVALAVGTVTALWAGLGAMQAMETAMNEVWDVPRREQPDFLVSRLRARRRRRRAG